jgi:acyl-CoA synthetase (AMP-forming)/AMP-acid ligase II
VNQRVNRLINALKSLGMKKGDHIGILANNCPQYFEVFALAKAGLVVVPLNYRLIATELEYTVNNSEITTVIVEKEYLDIIKTIKPNIKAVKNYICLNDKIPGMAEYEELIKRFPPDDPVDENDIATIYYSSGTTGRPKGAVHNHKSMVAELLLPVICPDLDLHRPSSR